MYTFTKKGINKQFCKIGLLLDRIYIGYLFERQKNNKFEFTVFLPQQEKYMIVKYNHRRYVYFLCEFLSASAFCF